MSSDRSHALVTTMRSYLLLFMKYAKETDLFLMDLILIRFLVKRLMLGPGFIMTSPEGFNNSDQHGLTCLKENDTQ